MSQETTAWLESVEKGDKYPLIKDQVSIGRVKENDLHFNFVEISSKHAVLLKKGMQWWIKDLGSTNGSFVNGQEVKGEAPLKNGDKIKLGRPEYVMHCPQPAAQPAAAPDKTMLLGSPAADKTMVVGAAQTAVPKTGDISISDFKRQFETKGDQPAPAGKSMSLHEEKTIIETAGTAGTAAKTPMHKASDSDLDKTTVGGGMQEMKTMIGGALQPGSAAAAGKVFAELEEKTLSTRKKSYPLTKIENKIGQADNCEIRLTDKSIAPHHATISFESRNRIMLTLADNNFSVKVNGKFFKNQPIKTGDTVEIGELAFVFKLIQFPKFKERKGGLKRVIIVALALIIILGGAYAYMNKDKQAAPPVVQTDDGKGGTTPVVSPTDLQASLTPIDEIWGMIERQRFDAAESKIEKYFMLQEETADSKKPYIPPQELNEASQAIDIYNKAQKMFDDAKFYDAMNKLNELPPGKAQTLELTKKMKDKISDTLNDFAEKEYLQGIRSFKSADFPTAQGHFEKAIEFYPGYKDSKTYLERIKIAIHYTKPLDEIKELLKSNRIERTLEVLDNLKEFDAQGLTPEAVADVKTFEETRGILFKHANIYMLYQSGQAKQALENFNGIPKSYSHYKDLERLADKIKEVFAAFEHAQSTQDREEFQKILTIEPSPNNFYNRESKKMVDDLIKNLHAKSDKIIEEGRALQGDNNDVAALKKYYEALQLEPNYKRAETLCESLAKDLLFNAYQLPPDQKRDKIAIYDAIIANTPKGSKINQDAMTQLDNLK